MSTLRINQLTTWNRRAQFAVVLLCALALKLYYSAASANQLRWILAPTTALVELVNGRSFAFESNAGYLSDDRSFLIAPACAGVNFLITAFLMIALRKWWRDGAQGQTTNNATSRDNAAARDSAPSRLATNSWLHRFPGRVRKFSVRAKLPLRAWSFIPQVALVAYLATLVANTARISIALWLRRAPLGTDWLSASQLHRLEGIVVYFGFLLLLYVVSEKLSSRSVTSTVKLEDASEPSPTNTTNKKTPHARRRPGLPLDSGRAPQRFGLFRGALFPLAIYYVTALGIPLVNGMLHQKIAATDFWEHSLFVLLTPLVLVLIVAAFRLYLSRRASLNEGSDAAIRTPHSSPRPQSMRNQERGLP